VLAPLKETLSGVFAAGNECAAALSTRLAPSGP